MDVITVVHRTGDDFSIIIRDHVLEVDQPFAGGGLDGGPTAVELFVASLAADAAHHGRRCLADYGLPAGDLEVGAEFTMSEEPPDRVARVRLKVRIPTRLAEHRSAELLAAMDRCAVRGSVLQAPDLHVDIDVFTGAV
ncbi:MAG: OsmC family protein [Streptosporangiaceae bacterium]|nr:OsmC family protein [Streptosporangiaceae bacterium]